MWMVDFVKTHSSPATCASTLAPCVPLYLVLSITPQIYPHAPKLINPALTHPLGPPSLPPGRAQSDKIFSQQSALGKVHEEVRLLREQLEARGAQQAVIEAEIARQVSSGQGCI